MMATEKPSLPSLDALRTAHEKAVAERAQLVASHDAERRSAAIAYVNGVNVELPGAVAKLAAIDAAIIGLAELEMAATYRQLWEQRLEAKVIIERPDGGGPFDRGRVGTKKDAAYALIELLDKKLNGLPDRAKAERIVAELEGAE